MVCCVLRGCMRVLLCDELCVVLFGVLLGGVVWCEGVLFLFFFSILFFLFLALSPSLFFPYYVLSSSFSSLFNSRQQTLCKALINKREHPSLLLSPPSSLSPPLPTHKKKREGTFYYRNISGEEFIFY